jgi:hypothetical protein
MALAPNPAQTNINTTDHLTATDLPDGSNQQSSATPKPSQTVEIPTATLSPTNIPPCPAPDGYSWSQFFASDTSFIYNILPAGDGNFYLSGVVDDQNGTWIAKMSPDGKLIWQKIVGNSMGNLQIASNGNLLLEFGMSNLELDPEGNSIQGVEIPWYQPNADGSYTVMGWGQAIRYTDPQTPIWQFSARDLNAFGTPTTDGGALFAYAGIYADESVYYRPIYTDIKVIKIDVNGQVWQRVYGKLVGDETLSILEATSDGGALLGGNHAYEELGMNYDVWLMKLNNTGSMSWQSTFKLAPEIENIDYYQLLNNGYILVLSSDYGEVQTLVRLNKNGSLAWQKQISSIRGGITILDTAETADGGLLLSAETNEKNSVAFLARLSPKGDLLWEKTFGFSQIPASPDIFIEAILPLDIGEFLVGGGTNLVGESISETYSAWMARVSDSGQKIGLLTLSPGKYSVGSTLSSRPNTLKDEVYSISDLKVKEIDIPIETIDYQVFPACLGKDAQIPTPAALPSLTPSMTPTVSFLRDLYLNDPAMEGDDVLLMQNRLLALGYNEVGTPDGSFGKMTNNAVRVFQEINGLEVDGYVGPFTWRRLFSQDAVGK